MSSSITSTSSTSCPAEWQSCQSDDSCTACVVEYLGAIDGCTSGYGSSYTCDELDEVLCCSITGGDDCAGNSVLQDYFSCVFEEYCVIDLGTCTSSGASTTYISSDTLTTAADDMSSSITSTSSCVFEEYCVIDLGTCTSSGASTTYISSDTLTTAADDMSSSITSTSSTSCPAEWQSCQSDDSCTACVVE
ncbi:unnamed protein product, partial [Pylaiella littoralis]